jgi:hypothetical protein
VRQARKKLLRIAPRLQDVLARETWVSMRCEITGAVSAEIIAVVIQLKHRIKAFVGFFRTNLLSVVVTRNGVE